MANFVRLAGALNSLDAITRLDACRKLDEAPADVLRSDAATDFVVALLNDASWKVRVAALNLLIKLPAGTQVGYASMVARMLKHVHPFIRKAACETMGKLPVDALRKHGVSLAELLRDKEMSVRDAALETLTNLPPAAKICLADPLSEMVCDRDAFIRASAFLALGTFPAAALTAHTQVLTDLLGDQCEVDRLVRVDARCAEMVALAKSKLEAQADDVADDVAVLGSLHAVPVVASTAAVAGADAAHILDMPEKKHALATCLAFWLRLVLLLLFRVRVDLNSSKESQSQHANTFCSSSLPHVGWGDVSISNRPYRVSTS